MKWLFGFLLLLSIILFAFMQWGGALLGAAKNGQTLAELYPEKIKLLDIPADKYMPASAALPLSQAGVASAALAASAVRPAVSAVLAVSAPMPISAPINPVASAVPASTPIPVPAPVTAPAAKTEAKACMEWGEFSGTDLARAEKSLSGLKLGDRMTRRTVEYANGYWVYIPPLKNHAAVNKKIAQIKADGVHDYYVVQEPPLWVNVISLGVFKTEEAAKKFQLSMKKKGVRTAKVGERKHRLKFTVFALKHIDADGRTQLAVLHNEFPNSELTTVACHN
jgi:hypothetical protein